MTVSISRNEAARRHIRRSDHVSCLVAFIDCKTPDRAPEVVEAAAAAGRTVDRSGFVAPLHLVPDYAFGKG